MASRNLDELLPTAASVAKEWLKRCTQDGVQVLVYCTYRSFNEQAALYAEGRSTPGMIRTKSKPGNSWHNWRRAWDAVPMINGKPDWSCNLMDEPHWQVMANHARELGIEWGGDWPRFKDCVHFQYREGLSLADARRTNGAGPA